MVKECPETLDSSLDILFKNIPLDERRATREEKISVVHIFKEVDRDIAQDYKTISVTCLISKLIENIIRKQFSVCLGIKRVPECERRENSTPGNKVFS